MLIDKNHWLAPIFSSHDGWTYQLVTTATPPDAFGASFSSLVALWASKRKDGNLPAWRDFDFSEFQDWWGWLTVIDLIAGPDLDGRFRLYGSDLVELLGRELTGKTLRGDVLVSESNEDGYESHDFDFLKDISLKPAIGFATGPVFWRNREYLSITTVRLPLADDGVTVDRILSGVRRFEAP